MITILQEAKDVRDELADTHAEYREIVERIRIKLNWRLKTTAGQAFTKKLVVQINPRIFARAENRPALRNTVIHEIAHVVADFVHGRRVSHGQAWRRICARLGGTTSRTHELDTKGLGGRTKEALCLKCDSVYPVSRVKWVRLSERAYRCSKCGGAVAAVGKKSIYIG